MAMLGWQEVFDPGFILALAALLTAIGGVITALKAHSTARQARSGARTAKAVADRDVPPLKATVGRNSGIITVLNQRIASLESSFHALLLLMEQNGNGGQYPSLPPSPTGGAPEPDQPA